MDWWRPERDRKWIYIHHSFCAPFDFWKGSRCASVHTAASIVAQWFRDSQMNMEQAQFATLAGSFPTERQTFSLSVTSAQLWRGGRGWERMRNVMTAAEWQSGENKTLWRASDAHIATLYGDAGNNVIICMEESLWDTRVMHCEQWGRCSNVTEGNDWVVYRQCHFSYK